MSNIEWTEATWNPVIGCSLASAGCTHCYAMTMAHRLAAMGQEPHRGLTHNVNGRAVWTGEVRTMEDRLIMPMDWRKPRRVFVNSMSDLFHPNVPDAFIAQVFAVMGLASWHTFQVLTKRPERMAALLNSEAFAEAVRDASQDWSEIADDSAQRFGHFNPLQRMRNDWRAQVHDELPMANVWLGTSVEDQRSADERIPHLLRCPAAVRFLSVEPLIGPVDVAKHLPGREDHGSPLSGARTVGGCVGWVPGIDWMIVGGESGPGARPCNVEWIRFVVEQCKAAGVPVFVKQLGATPVGSDDTTFADGWPGNGGVPGSTDLDFKIGDPWFCRYALRDHKGGDMDEWPEDLRVRQWPNGEAH